MTDDVSVDTYLLDRYLAHNEDACMYKKLRS